MCLMFYTRKREKEREREEKQKRAFALFFSLPLLQLCVAQRSAEECGSDRYDAVRCGRKETVCVRVCVCGEREGGLKKGHRM